MPCYDDRNSPEYIYKENKEIVDKLTRLLCEACHIVQKELAQRQMSAELRAWWANHQEVDRRRAQEEAQKRYRENQKALALGKLTIEERKLLGLYRK